MKCLKKTIVVSTFLTFVFALNAVTVQADLLSLDEKNHFKEHNTSASTLSIRESTNGVQDTMSLVALFNNYFSDELGLDTYGSNMDLYNARGVHEDVQTWNIGQDAQLISSFRNAGLGHAINIVDSAGQIQNQVLEQAGGGYDTVFKDLNAVDLGITGDYNFMLETTAGQEFYGDTSLNTDDGLVHMVALDVTDLVQEKLDNEAAARGETAQTIDSAYLFGWEDLLWSHYHYDSDFQDIAYILVNVKPNTTSTTPEPASALIFGFGALGLAAYRFRKGRKA